MLRTFDYRLVAGVGTFEFHPITDAILDWQLLKTWLPVINLTVVIICPSCLKGG